MTSWMPYAVPVIVPGLIYGLKRLYADTPKWLLPYIAPVIGGALASLNALFNGEPITPDTVRQGVLLGLAGIGLREIFDQTKTVTTGQQ